MSDSERIENPAKSINLLLSQLAGSPESVEFNQVIETIHTHYDYTPTRFTNGQGDTAAINEAGSNEGSCKIFAFAHLHGLDAKKTLNCFGNYYREDVLQNPEGSDHGNIRNFMRYGWSGIKFDSPALAIKSSV